MRISDWSSDVCSSDLPVSPIDDEVKWFLEKREGIEARPGLIKRTGDCQLRRALFEVFGDLGACAATQLQLQAREGMRQLPQHRCERSERDRPRDRHR